MNDAPSYQQVNSPRGSVHSITRSDKQQAEVSHVNTLITYTLLCSFNLKISQCNLS